MQYSMATTVYNDENEIIHFLDCLLRQTLLPTEIVIADGGSSDNTVQLIKQYAAVSTTPIKLLEGKRLNIAEGFNEAIKHTENDYIAIVAVGNWYPPNFVSDLSNEFSLDISLDAVYSIIKGREDTFFSRVYTRAFIGDGMYLRYATNHGVLIKKSIIEEMGFFYEGFEYAGEDYEFFMHFLEQGKKSKCVDTVSLTWNVPKTFSEYCKQVKVYTIGNMQMYNNLLLLYINKIPIFYFVLCCASIICLGIVKEKLVCLCIILLVILTNVRWMIKRGLIGALMKNVDCFLRTAVLFKERKFFLNKNKIDKTRRIVKR